jgi:hypothetical protein
MSEARAFFHSQLRGVVREAQQVGPVRVMTPPPPKRTVIRLWLPLTPLWIVLAPFALLLAPALLLVPQTRGLPPYRTVVTIGGALLAMSGTVIAIDGRDALVHVRIF